MAPRAKAAATKAAPAKKASASNTAPNKVTKTTKAKTTRAKTAKAETAMAADDKVAKKTAAKKTAEKKTEPTTNGASKKRKAEAEEELDDVPKAKKSKTATRDIKPATKPSAKATKAKAAPKKAKSEEPEPKAKKETKKEVVPKKAAPKKAAPKKEKAAPKPKPVSKAPQIAIGKKINSAPTQILDVYVFGEGSSGELGLGSKRVDHKKPIDVKRPRLNPNLAAATVGVVQVACGGMHVAALTHDNKILTWGVNDQGALGRDTTWSGGLRDMGADDSSDDSDDEDDTGINPNESVPAAVSDEYFAPGTKFTQVVAGDSATFVLTEDGRVYGWGTFRSSDGILGFSQTVRIQSTPALIPELKQIKALAAGSNHILALDLKGHVVAWGCGQQNQLGRRIIERNKMSSLIPQGVGLPRGKIQKVACGSYHSFALDKKGQVWGWGLNNFGEIGIEANAGEDDAVILRPAKIELLEDHFITDIDGGEHHSLARSDQGDLFTWGRVDGYQVGFELDKFTKDNAIYDERENPRILFKPTIHPDVADTTSVTAGTDNSFAITGEGKAYSWGFSSNYQTGQGTMDDIHTPTLIDNTAIRGKKIIWAGAGGQYSVLVGASEEAPNVNGVEANGTTN